LFPFFAVDILMSEDMSTVYQLLDIFVLMAEIR